MWGKNFIRYVGPFLPICIVLLLVIIQERGEFVIRNYNHEVVEGNSSYLTIHFSHGSRILADSIFCIGPKKRLGSVFGGHVETQIDTFIFGFIFRDSLITLTNKIPTNSNFYKIGLTKWKKQNYHEHITSIEIPVDSIKLNRLKVLYEKYINEAAYDYVFFGQRCTSSSVEMLSDCKIIDRLSNFEAIVAFFYPKQLRSIFVQLAIEKNYRISTVAGAPCRIWETDQHNIFMEWLKSIL